MSNARSCFCLGLAALSLALSSCMTPRATPPVLILGDFADQKDFFLARPYTYRIGSTAHAITVAEGFVTDMTSIPPPLRMFLSVHGRYGRAAVVHDYLYWSQACTKAQADNLLLIAMKESGVGRAKAWTIYQGVAKFGTTAWNANRAERAARRPKVMDAAHTRLADTMTWPQVRQRLIADGVRDPDMPVSPAACALGNWQSIP